MLPILGKPIVERVMETLCANGINDFILVVSRDDRDIVKYFNEESELEFNITFVVQEERLGMANALQRAAPFIHQDFVLSACDNLAPVQHVAELIERQQADETIHATLSLMRIDPSSVSKTGIVEMMDGRVTHIVEKPQPEEAPSDIASLPLYVFTSRILDYLPQVPLSPRGEYELQDAIQMLIEADGGVQGVFFVEGRLTLTGPDDLLAINRHYLLNGYDRPQLAPFTVGNNTHLITPLRIEQGTVIGEGCVIGPRVYIERDCHIGSNVTIKDAVVLRESAIEDGAMIVGQVVS
jgi:bifunctional UDP-N-acetylglucosamine pyrophosphorylase/glucosamine-1-phosphate N-acetyltransferase